MPWRINSRFTQSHQHVSYHYAPHNRASHYGASQYGVSHQHTSMIRVCTRALLCLLLLAVLVAGCSSGRSSPTRTPFPTWTPTPSGGGQDASAAQAVVNEPSENSLAVAAAPVADSSEAAPQAAEAVQPAEAAAPAAQPEAPADAPATPVPVEEPTATPEPTEEPTPVPTETPTPAGPQYDFELEAAEKFPTDSLAENVVRIFLYVYGGGEFALSGYSLVVAHNQSSLPVDAFSTAGLPDVTRDEPGKFTRFTNMNAIFIEPQGGTWAIQLVNDVGVAVGPPAFLELDPDDTARELYVRYRLK